MIDLFEYCDLVPKLNHWADLYAKGTPAVEDVVYDTEYRKLKEFEFANPDMIDSNSPTKKIASDTSDGFKKVEHKIQMISIANSNGYDELREWTEKMGNDSCCREQVIEFKMDGLAMSLHYNNGILYEAVTRGDGKVGDSVIGNVMQIESIPKEISYKEPIEIRGEVVWHKDDFMAFNDYLESIGKPLMSNPRNGAAGTMKLHDPNEVKRRKLHFVAYNIATGSPKTTQYDDLDFLMSIGFTVFEHHICHSADEVIKYAHEMEKQRFTLPFNIDGEVVKVNDKTQYARLGGTAKTPHFCTALKFPPEEKETVLLDIEHSYGRTGAVTPVAIIKEVELALTKVNRVSVHNWDILEYLGLFKGCHVVVRKAGEIIPEIVKCTETGRSKDDYDVALDASKDVRQLASDLHYDSRFVMSEWYLRPIVCKHCGATLVQDVNRSGDNLVAWVCPNDDCSMKNFKQIVKFVSKDSMNIMGVGESLIENMLSKGIIVNYTDLYKITVDKLKTLDGIKEKSAIKIYDSIMASKKDYLNQLLSGLGIPSLGKTLSLPIAEKFKSLQVVSNADISEFESMDGVGHELAVSIHEWFKSHVSIVNDLINLGVALTAKPSVVKTHKLDGMTFIMTGSFDTLDRDVFKKMVIENGGSIAGSITKSVNYVLMGDGAGPAKKKKIAELQGKGHQITIIEDVTIFLDMLK